MRSLLCKKYFILQRWYGFKRRGKFKALIHIHTLKWLESSRLMYFEIYFNQFSTENSKILLKPLDFFPQVKQLTYIVV